ALEAGHGGRRDPPRPLRRARVLRAEVARRSRVPPAPPRRRRRARVASLRDEARGDRLHARGVRRGVGRHRVGGDAPHRRLRRAAEAVLGEGRVSRAARALWLAAALVALASGEALATCPPFTGGSGNWLERFAASRGGRAAPPSDAELHDWLRRENIPPIGVVPPSGPAPLSVRARWLYDPVADPAKIELDAGDGRQQTLGPGYGRSEEHTSELQSRSDLVCRLLLEKKKIHP